jgi:hypothetical protein
LNNSQKIKEKKIRDRLYTMQRILIHAEESFKIVEFLENDKGDNSTIILLKNINPFFYFVRVNFLRTTVVELYKLFKESEEYSFFKLLEKFDKKKEFESFSEKIDKISIEKELNVIREEIKNIIKHRQKFYAHLDKFKNKQNSFFIMEDTRDVLETGKKIYNLLSKNLMGETHNFDFPIGNPLDSLKACMEKLALN